MENQYNIIKIQRYLAGQLSPQEMHELEREALDDPFLADAIEGYGMQNQVNHGQLSLLQQRLAQRIAGKQQDKNLFFFNSQRLGIAATAAVLFVLVTLLYFMRNSIFTTDESYSAATEKQKEFFIEGELPQKINVTPVAELTADTDLSASPLMGWEAYNQYIQDTFKWGEAFQFTRVGDQYNIQFKVNEQGMAYDIQIHQDPNSTEPIHPDLAHEIRKLLSAGPKWEGEQGALNLSFTK